MAKLNLFISYSHEDQKIAEALCTMFGDIFGEDILVFFDRECVHAGEEIDDKIKAELKHADTMIVISTGAVRPSYSWTGFELGYFIAKHDPGEGVRGRVISICTYDDVPPTEEARKYVSLEIEKELLDVDPVRANQNIGITDSDELLQLLGDFVLAIDGIKLSEKKARRDQCKKHAKQFKLAVVEVFKVRIKEVRKPQKQFLIRYNIKDVDLRSEVLPPSAMIISLGDAIGLFGIPNTHPFLQDEDISEVPLVVKREKGRLMAKGMKWSQLQQLIAADPLALHWSSALCQVVISAGVPTFDVDNSQVIFTHNGEKRYRLFLTTSTTFHDGTVEASVYLVEAFREKDYGSPDTSLLLKGLDIVCRFRFLFLENQSDFYWFNVDGWGSQRLPKMARQLLTELSLLRTEAEGAELHKPGSWAAFVPKEVLQQMMDTWKPLAGEIRRLCLLAIEPGADESKLSQILTQLKEQFKLVEEKCSAHNGLVIGAIAAKLAASVGTPPLTSDQHENVDSQVSVLTI